MKRSFLLLYLVLLVFIKLVFMLGFPSCIRQLKMPVMKRYVLRLFISLKYITANVVDRSNGRIVATSSTAEQSIKESLECGRSCNAKAATVVGEVLARRLKVEGLNEGEGRGIHANIGKEVGKKGFKNQTKVWAVMNALKNNGVKLVLDDENDDKFLA